MNRRALLIGLLASLLTTQADARGSATKRARRRQAIAEAWARERQRRAALTPEQRALEDAEDGRRFREWQSQRAVREEREAREWKATRSLLITLGGMVAIFGGTLGLITFLNNENGAKE